MKEGIFESLRGKRVLITGSSRGIGKALADGFARNGADVVIHCVTQSITANNTLSELRKYGTNVDVVYGDLNDKNVPRKVYIEAKELLGGIDILICNASVQIRNNWIDITDDEYDMQMNVNVRSTVKLAQLAVPDMIERKWGRIVTIGSVQQLKPHPDMLIYSASKCAVVNMVKSMALLLAEDNITVNNVAPGTIYTDRNADVLRDTDYKAKVCNDIPSKRIGEADDCVGLVLTLCSESGRYITGEDIFIDGGKHI